MNEVWKVYYYVCNKCDASIEITTKRARVKDPKCSCNIFKGTVTLISINDVKGKVA